MSLATPSRHEEVDAFHMDLEKFYEEDHTFYKDNIDEECDRLVEHLHDSTKKAESFKTAKRCLSLETIELIHQRAAARAAENQELTSEIARLCREAIKEDLKRRRAEVLAEAAEAGKSIRYARRDSASRTTRMTALRNPKGTAIASDRGMRKSSTTSTLISSTAMSTCLLTT
ncbi:hypothetical protein RB195_010503 [Necator americanus]|uniref:Uncharacterized protein n=1 Tax=Necator americanus TaxID=51031 RepID=A0ABR1CY81_NECAM